MIEKPFKRDPIDDAIAVDGVNRPKDLNQLRVNTVPKMWS